MEASDIIILSVHPFATMKILQLFVTLCLVMAPTVDGFLMAPSTAAAGRTKSRTHNVVLASDRETFSFAEEDLVDKKRNQPGQVEANSSEVKGEGKTDTEMNNEDLVDKKKKAVSIEKKEAASARNQPGKVEANAQTIGVEGEVGRIADKAVIEDEKEEETPKYGTLRVHGPDQKGIVAAFSQTLYGHGCGVTSSEQSTDSSTNLFFQRIRFDYSTMHTDKISLERGIREVCDRFGMQLQLDWNKRRKRIAIMVSKYDHCLWELLLRHQAGELDCDISVIISNHPDLEKVAKTFGIPFQVFTMTKETKAEQEVKELELLKEVYDVDLVILARYMQIISSEFCNAFPHRVINIHHSFLPAFIGGRPYHRAHERGVKLIGATAHYATADLDEGPIIEQDIIRISHRDSVDDLIRKGRTLEKTALVTAVKAHIEDRIIVYNNKCVVFGD